MADLSRFAELNKRKASFDERAAVVRQMFPDEAILMDANPSKECEEAWSKRFDREPELMGRILRDIVKIDQLVPGKPGPRPGLDSVRAGPEVDRLIGRDYLDRPYSVLNFAESLSLLAGDMTMTKLGRKAGIPRSQVHRLIRGEAMPTRQMIEQVAKAFGKQPSWFLEYRIGTVASVLVNQLMHNPESSIRGFEIMAHLGLVGGQRG